MFEIERSTRRFAQPEIPPHHCAFYVRRNGLEVIQAPTTNIIPFCRNCLLHAEAAPALKQVPPTNVQVAASAYAPPSSYSYPSCTPDGCIPEYTLDGNTATRWWCKGELIEDGDEGCWIEYYFDEPQDIVEIGISFSMGTYRSSKLNVYADGAFQGEIPTGGPSIVYASFYLDTDEITKLKISLADWESFPSMWISIAEVQYANNVMVRLLLWLSINKITSIRCSFDWRSASNIATLTRIHALATFCQTLR